MEVDGLMLNLVNTKRADPNSIATDLGVKNEKKKLGGRARLKERQLKRRIDKRLSRTRQLEQSSDQVEQFDIEKTAKVKLKKSKTQLESPVSSTKRPKQTISSLFTHNPDVPQVERQTVKVKSEPVFSYQSFSDLNLHAYMISNLENRLKLSTMTTVQKEAIPNLLDGKDALIRSQTGTGKTLAYAIPIVETLGRVDPKIQRCDGPYALVLLPTRELALQSYDVISKLVQPYHWLVPGCIMGGEKKKSEKARIRKGINILVATPGRLVDHLEHTESLKLSRVKWVVLDEADRLLDLGFEKDIAAILNKLNLESGERQSVLLSATLSEAVKSLACMSLKDPVYVNIQGDVNTASNKDVTSTMEQSIDVSTPKQLRQYFIIVPSKLRLVTLAAFIISKCKLASESKMIIFLSSKDSVEFHYSLLINVLNDEDNDDDDLEIFQLHGSMPQEERRKVYLHFVECTTGVLLCTDVAARGLDLPEVKWIVQYNTPGTAAEYIHRVGRTARIGKKGQALLFLAPSEVEYVQVLGSHKLSLQEIDMNGVLKHLLLYKMGRMKRTVEESATALQRDFEEWVNQDIKFQKLARSAYQSFTRAYATYPSEFKHIFHIKRLHLGHVAKSFALREAPQAIGNTLPKRKFKKILQKKRKPGICDYSSGLDGGGLVLRSKKRFKKR
ncbi:ATP-dependent DNA helicase DDX31-like [Saccoglossus kowalevskii]|uniref:ATP-dependent RNA helicase n=1 Tax=Saccoglossus kowalevskii TaxID=10224 RepID=A0ABM0GLG9_SACKO|nr:PREDICTED: probable ATP-dependent RNA helicase DDX31-like [Saccoglossus kowalevskii]